MFSYWRNKQLVAFAAYMYLSLASAGDLEVPVLVRQVKRGGRGTDRDIWLKAESDKIVIFNNQDEEYKRYSITENSKVKICLNSKWQPVEEVIAQLLRRLGDLDVDRPGGDGVVNLLHSADELDKEGLNPRGCFEARIENLERKTTFGNSKNKTIHFHTIQESDPKSTDFTNWRPLVAFHKANLRFLNLLKQLDVDILMRAQGVKHQEILEELRKIGLTPEAYRKTVAQVNELEYNYKEMDKELGETLKANGIVDDVYKILKEKANGTCATDGDKAMFLNFLVWQYYDDMSKIIYTPDEEYIWKSLNQKDLPVGRAWLAFGEIDCRRKKVNRYQALKKKWADNKDTMSSEDIEQYCKLLRWRQRFYPFSEEEKGILCDILNQGLDGPKKRRRLVTMHRLLEEIERAK